MDKCCNSCAFLECNRGKTTPADIKKSADNRNWYDQTTIDSIWNDVMEQGQFLTCHSTDPRYYAVEGKKPIMACLGMTMCVFMHLKIYEHLGFKYGQYKKTVGYKVAITKDAAVEATMAIALGRADFFGKMLIPTDFHMSLDSLRYPTGFEKTVEYFKKYIADGCVSEK